MVLAERDLNDALLSLFCVAKHLRRYEALHERWHAVVLDHRQSELAVGPEAESVHGARFRQDHRMVATCADLLNLVVVRHQHAAVVRNVVGEHNFLSFHDFREGYNRDLASFLAFWDV